MVEICLVDGFINLCFSCFCELFLVWEGVLLVIVSSCENIFGVLVCIDNVVVVEKVVFYLVKLGYC